MVKTLFRRVINKTHSIVVNEILFRRIIKKRVIAHYLPNCGKRGTTVRGARGMRLGKPRSRIQSLLSPCLHHHNLHPSPPRHDTYARRPRPIQ